jgi:hypothetical protein
VRRRRRSMGSSGRGPRSHKRQRLMGPSSLQAKNAQEKVKAIMKRGCGATTMQPVLHRQQPSNAGSAVICCQVWKRVTVWAVRILARFGTRAVRPTPTEENERADTFNWLIASVTRDGEGMNLHGKQTACGVTRGSHIMKTCPCKTNAESNAGDDKCYKHAGMPISRPAKALTASRPSLFRV